MRRFKVFIVLLCYSFLTDALDLSARVFGNLIYTRHRRHAEENVCILPPHPDHGEWKLLNGNSSPGQRIPKNSVIKFECNLGYKLSGNQYVVCDDKWTKFPECEAVCPPLYSTATVRMVCKDKRGKDVKCNEATEGTYLIYSCADFYETPFGYKKTLLCSQGSWNYPKPVCQPVCGKIIVNDAKPLIYGGIVNEKLKYPWVTAVYKKTNDTYQNICGGSILSLKVVITAAHCVTNDYGDVLPKEDYIVGAGKLYNEYQHPKDPHAQYLELSKIIVHENYKGDRRRFLADIAILVTKSSFVLNEVVQPVCFNDVHNIALHAGSIGEISGWGKTEGGLASEVLRTLKIPYKYETTCALELPPDWADKYNMADKICAGFFNQSTSVCSGDSGSGLAFKNPDDNRYYLHGLVSLGPTKQGDCNIQQNALYTKIAFYYEFIDRLLSTYVVGDEDCILPSHPQNGKWTIDKQDRKPGDAVASNTILKIKCNLGFKLSSTTSSVECRSAQNMPTCQLLCPTLTFSKGTNYRCTDKENKDISCFDAVDGSTLYYNCPDGYKFPDGTTGVRACVIGSWGSPHPECLKDDATPTPVTPSVSPTETVVTPTGLVPSHVGEESDVSVICTYAASRYYESNVDPDDLNSSLCDYVIYSSVGLLADGSLKLQGAPVPAGGTRSLFHKVADMKIRNKKLKVLLRVEGSGYENKEYPTMAADTEKRNTFIRSVTSFMETYKFDGVDIYWIPQITSKENLGELLKELRKVLYPKGFLLVLSVYINPTYLGYDERAIVPNVDWVNILNYDNYLENSKYTGQYSAFKSSSKESEWDMELNNLVNAGTAWNGRGIPRNKIALSIAFYGRYFTLENPKKHGIRAPTVQGQSGLLTYSEICQKYGNWKRVWDNEQKNPYKYSGNKWFGYDDPQSVQIKANYISRQEFFGVHIYSIDADDIQGKCGSKQGLLQYVHQGLENLEEDSEG